MTSIIEGSLIRDQTLTASSTIEGQGTFEYQWLIATSVDGQYDIIIGATNSTYIIQAEDVYKYIEVTITYTDIDSSVTIITSEHTGIIGDSGWPSPPRNVVVTPGHYKLTISWDPSLRAGTSGYYIREYLVFRIDEYAYWWNGGGTSFTLTGLIPGHQYLFGIAAMNSSEWWSTSIYTLSCTPLPPNEPGIPTNVNAVAGDGYAVIRATALDNGGSTITSYNVTSWIGDVSGSVTTANTLPLIVVNLNDATEYTFTVVAINDIGHSIPSEHSNTIISCKPTATIDGIPKRDQTLIATSTIATIDGQGILQYKWAIAPSTDGPYDIIIDATNSTYIIQSIAIDKYIKVTVKYTITYTTDIENTSNYEYTNEATSDPTGIILNVEYPSIPYNVVVTPGYGEIILTWDAPHSTGTTGNTINNYIINISEHYAYWTNSSATTFTFPNLIAGLQYNFSIAAKNSGEWIGITAYTSNSTPLDAIVPDIPTNVVAIAGNNSASISWSLPAYRGSPITDFTVSCTPPPPSGNSSISSSINTLPSDNTTNWITGGYSTYLNRGDVGYGGAFGEAPNGFYMQLGSVIGINGIMTYWNKGYPIRIIGTGIWDNSQTFTLYPTIMGVANAGNWGYSYFIDPRLPADRPGVFGWFMLVSFEWQYCDNITPVIFNTLSNDVDYTFSVTAKNSIGVGDPGTVSTRPRDDSIILHVNNLPTGSVNISGICIQGNTLTAENTIEDLDGRSDDFTYQWYSSITDNGTITAITDATDITYTLKIAQVGMFISVSISYTDLYNTLESVSSSYTTIIVGLAAIVNTSTPTEIADTLNTQVLTDEGRGEYAAAQVASQFVDNNTTQTNIAETLLNLNDAILHEYCSSIFHAIDSNNNTIDSNNSTDISLITSGEQSASIINESGGKSQVVLGSFISEATSTYCNQPPQFALLLQNIVNNVNVVDDTEAAATVASIFTSITAAVTITPDIFAAIINVKDNMPDNLYTATIEYLEQTMSESSYIITDNNSLLYNQSKNSVTSGAVPPSIVASIAKITKDIDGKIIARTYALPVDDSPWYLMMTPDVPYTFTYNNDESIAIFSRTVNPITKNITNIHLTFNDTQYTVGDYILLGGKLHFLYKLGGLGGAGGIDDNSNARCFVTGTQILTVTGYKAVETLAPSDMIVTADGRNVSFNLCTTIIKRASENVAPYIIPANTFGANSPVKNLTISPHHAIQSRKGVWQIPKYAMRMFKGIKQVDIGKALTYYHVELPNYFTDNIVTDGTIVESFAAKQTTGMKNVYKFNSKINGFTRISKNSSIIKKE